MPTVTSRSSRASSGCHVRSACSSSSCGSRRAAARIISSTYSAIGRENTPRAFVITMPRARDAGVSTRSTPAVAEWTQRSCGARARIRSKVSAGSRPRSITSTSSSGPSGWPSNADRDEARARAPRRGCLEVAGTVARRQDRASARSPSGRPPGPLPGPGRPVRTPRSRPARPVSWLRPIRCTQSAGPVDLVRSSAASPGRPTAGAGRRPRRGARSRPRSPRPYGTAPS